MQAIRASLVAALVLAAVAGAAAQETTAARRAEWVAFPGGAIVFTGAKDAPDFQNYAFGTAFAWNISRRVAAEGEAAFGIGASKTLTFDGRVLTAQPTPDTISYAGQLIVNLTSSRRRLSPFVAGGAGALTLAPHDGTANIGVTERRTMPTANVGGGVKWYAVDDWGVRADYRLTIVGHTDEAPSFFKGAGGMRYGHRLYVGGFTMF